MSKLEIESSFRPQKINDLVLEIKTYKNMICFCGQLSFSADSNW